MTRGQLPRAYLRISPNLDQHAEPLVMLLLICGANRQSRRGYFSSRAVIDRIVGRRAAERAIGRGDLVPAPDALNGFYLDGWAEWQEGDITVGERMARLRDPNRRNNGVTRPLPERIPPSEASRRLGVEVVSPSGEPTARAQGREAEDPFGEGPEGEALSWLAAHGCAVRVGDGYHRQLVTAVENHGINAVVGMMDRLARAGTKHGDTKGYLYGAIDALNAAGRPKLAELEADERDDERDRAHRARLEQTRRYIEQLTGEQRTGRPVYDEPEGGH